MLTELKITNIAVIESAVFQPGSGFTCLTGETGAGKSILLGSLGAVIGHKVSRDLIRTGEEIYPLKEALQDTYLYLMMDEAIRTGQSVHTEQMPWNM